MLCVWQGEFSEKAKMKHQQSEYNGQENIEQIT